MAETQGSSRKLLTLSFCLALAALIAWALGRGPAPGRDDLPTEPAAASGAEARPVSSDVAAPPPDAFGAREDSSIPQTKLPLRLLATVVRKNPALSLATVEGTEGSAHDVMSEGEGFSGFPRARIARIERGRILIDNDGMREQLVIDFTARAEGVDLEPSPDEREQRRDLSRRLRELTDAGTDYRDVLGNEERGGLLAEGDVNAVYEDGEMVGVQLDGIREGGVYDRFGLRNGDVVTGINGVSLADGDAAAEVMAQFVTSDELNVQVERGDGSQATLQISTDEFRTAVGQLP